MMGQLRLRKGENLIRILPQLEKTLKVTDYTKCLEILLTYAFKTRTYAVFSTLHTLRPLIVGGLIKKRGLAIFPGRNKWGGC